MRLTATLLILTTGLFAQVPAPATPKIRTLIISGQNGHDWRTVDPLLRKALEDTGRFEVRVTEEFRGAGPETLAPYDLVILNYADGRKAGLRFGDRTDTALLDFVKSGKGLVLYHFSAAAFEGWTEFEKLSGGNWRSGAGHHSAAHDFTVEIKDANHPITHGLPSSLPQPHDELYANLKWQPDGCCHILATAWDDHSLYKTPQQQPVPGAGKAEPMLWTVDYGKGRMYADMLGHDGPAVQTPTFVKLFTRGAEWAATGKVTLP